MVRRKRIEIYSAGCYACRDAEAAIRRLAGANHDVDVYNTQRADVAGLAALYGIRSVPAVVIDGRPISCCTDRGLDEAVLRSALAA